MLENEKHIEFSLRKLYIQFITTPQDRKEFKHPIGRVSRLSIACTSTVIRSIDNFRGEVAHEGVIYIPISRLNDLETNDILAGEKKKIERKRKQEAKGEMRASGRVGVFMWTTQVAASSFPNRIHQPKRVEKK